jgi:hypothetical protein
MGKNLTSTLPLWFFFQLTGFEEVLVFRTFRLASERARAPLIPTRFTNEKANFLCLEAATALLEPTLKTPKQCVESFPLFASYFY